MTDRNAGSLSLPAFPYPDAFNWSTAPPSIRASPRPTASCSTPACRHAGRPTRTPPDPPAAGHQSAVLCPHVRTAPRPLPATATGPDRAVPNRPRKCCWLGVGVGVPRLGSGSAHPRNLDQHRCLPRQAYAHTRSRAMHPIHKAWCWLSQAHRCPSALPSWCRGNNTCFRTPLRVSPSRTQDRRHLIWLAVVPQSARPAPGGRGCQTGVIHLSARHDVSGRGGSGAATPAFTFSQLIRYWWAWRCRMRTPPSPFRASRCRCIWPSHGVCKHPRYAMAGTLGPIEESRTPAPAAVPAARTGHDAGLAAVGGQCCGAAAGAAGPRVGSEGLLLSSGMWRPSRRT